MTDHTPLLRVSNVSKRFGDTIALDDVSLEIRHNEFFALLGPSGCGKTTLLRAIAGFTEPDSGELAIDMGTDIGTDTGANPADGTSGMQDLVALPPNRRPVNLMFQSYALFPHMSVERNVGYGLEQEKLAKDEIRDRVAEALATVGLTEKASARPNQLSGGQRQRVALARAIVKRPKILLLDEPLSALDRKVRAEMQLELKRLQHEFGITFVVVTHDQEEAMSMADRIAVLHEGRVQQIAAPVELYTRPANSFVAGFIGASTMIPGAIVAEGLRLSDGTVLPAANPLGLTGAGLLMLRPEDIEPCAVDTGSVNGTVIETHFYGGSSMTSLRVAGFDGVVSLTQAGSPRFGLDDRTGLRWDADRAVLLQGS